jgi:rRNA maturation endonuclease Nob1
MNLYHCEACHDVYVSSWPLDPCPSCGAPGKLTQLIEPEPAAAIPA